MSTPSDFQAKRVRKASLSGVSIKALDPLMGESVARSANCGPNGAQIAAFMRCFRSGPALQDIQQNS